MPRPIQAKKGEDDDNDDDQGLRVPKKEENWGGGNNNKNDLDDQVPGEEEEIIICTMMVLVVVMAMAVLVSATKNTNWITQHLSCLAATQDPPTEIQNQILCDATNTKRKALLELWSLARVPK